jgi:predicted DNA-binding transcriptional regulator AlpA
MPEYEFTLKFKLQNADVNPEIYVEKLYDSGCDDALIGIGKKGYIALDFIRESLSAEQAIISAINDLKKVIPKAILETISPDLVGVTDIATLLGCSRQNIRKLMLKDNLDCPPALYNGAQSIWHLSEILAWLAKNKNYPIDESLIEIAKIAMNLNIAKQYNQLDPNIQKKFKTLVI